MELAVVGLNSAEQVSPDDTRNLLKVCKALYVGTGGDLNVVLQDSTVQLFKNVPSGSTLWIKASRVNNTLTTAADIIALHNI